MIKGMAVMTIPLISFWLLLLAYFPYSLLVLMSSQPGVPFLTM